MSTLPRLIVALHAHVSFTATAQGGGFIPGYKNEVRAMDPRDVALLPPFCRYTQDFREKLAGGNDEVQQRRWEGTLGPSFHHLHHYCYGLMKANRGLFLARTQQAKTYYLNDAIAEFNYVIDRAPDDFILLPEMLARQGQAQLHLGQAFAANESIERAISIKPDYWLPYAVVSDFYKGNGDTERALEWIRRGLKSAPSVQALQSRLAELDGAAQQAGSKKSPPR